VLGYVGATEIVKLAYFKKLVKPKIETRITARARLLDVVAVLCLRFESEISIDSLLEDLNRSVGYPLSPQQTIYSLHHLRKVGLVSINWHQRTVRREKTMKEYVMKQVASEHWPNRLKDWLKIASAIQTKYGRTNPEYQALLKSPA
jgi:hypothetical protein